MSALKLKGRLTGAIKHWFGKSSQTNSEQSNRQTTPAPMDSSGVTSPLGQSTPNAHSQVSSYALALPLQTIVGQLPPELQSRVVVKAQNVTVSVPMQTILPQLAHGSVKISFGELRALAPGVFSTATDRDHVLVQLPLSEILSRISPSALRRRQNQKRIEVPEDITGPFDDYGKSVFISAPEPVTQVVRQPAPTVTASRAQPAAEPAAPQRFVQQARAAQQPQTVPKQTAPHPGVPAPQTLPPKRTVVQKTSPPATPEQKQARPVTTQHGVPPPPQAAQPKPVRRAEPSSTAAPKEDVLLVPLAQISESWPELVKQEIAISNLSRAFAALPAKFVETGLKQARIICTWKQLRGWLRPPQPKDAVSMCDDIALELPLRVVAPLFLAHNPRNQSQKKADYDAGIPDVFYTPGSAPKPGVAVLEQPVPVAGLSDIAEHECQPVEPKQPEPLPETDYYVWHDDKEVPIDAAQVFKKGTTTPGTDFLRRFAPPNEIVARAVALDGVAGALIALPDGLLVAAKVPPEFNADTLAAFLPQMFARVSQCTKELRMGQLNNLNFTVGNVPWRIFKIGAIFFAAFGRAGVPLPTAQLASLAAELDRKPRQTDH